MFTTPGRHVKKGLVWFALCSVVLAVIFTRTYTAARDGQHPKCRECHERIYQEATNSRHQHPVVLEDCSMCHAFTDENEAKIVKSIKTTDYHRDTIFHLGKLDDRAAYTAVVSLSDRDGKTASESSPSLATAKIGEYHGKDISVRRISDVHVAEIRKGVLVEATVRWHTDGPATTEVSYRMSDEKGMTHLADSTFFSREHHVTLTGLRHKKRYVFKVMSRDIFHHAIESEEFSFETTENLSRPEEPGPDDRGQPVSVVEVKMFRSPARDGYYLYVSGSKPAVVTEKLLEEKEPDELELVHGGKFMAPRYSRIDACSLCHPQDASHPVGIRSKRRDVYVPADLPTIENGMLTCATCHFPHGGPNKFLARFKHDKLLCKKCHLLEDVFKF